MNKTSLWLAVCFMAVGGTAMAQNFEPAIRSIASYKQEVDKARGRVYQWRQTVDRLKQIRRELDAIDRAALDGPARLLLGHLVSKIDHRIAFIEEGQNNRQILEIREALYHYDMDIRFLKTLNDSKSCGSQDNAPATTMGHVVQGGRSTSGIGAC